MSTINYELIAFKSISEFTKELGEIFTSKDKNHSLKLYEHLLNKTTLILSLFCLITEDNIFLISFLVLLKIQNIP